MNEELPSIIFYMALGQIGVGLLLVGLAIPLILRKVPMNAFYGVRFSASFKADWLWYEINAYGGKVMLVSGVAWSLYGVYGIVAAPAWFLSGLTVVSLGIAAMLVLLCYLKAGKLEKEFDRMAAEQGGSEAKDDA